MAKILGIDLGTTNSCVAVVEGVATPRVLPNRTGSHTTPSIVAFTEEGERLVGHIAKRQAVTNPENTIFAIKRLIGRKFESPEVQTARQLHLPYTVVGAKNGDAHVRVREQVLSPEEISGILLRELRVQAEEALGEEAEEAIVTVPAYFDDSQRQATRDACRIAGLEVQRIINEPTAAALAYCLDQRRGSLNIAVFDLGGGTFDISIMELSDGIFEVRATNGDVYLGGEDFDRRIMDWLIGEFERETGVNLRGRPHGAAAAEGSGRASQGGALDHRRGHHQPAVHLGRGRRAAPPGARAHPRALRGAGGRAGRAHRRALLRRAAPGRPRPQRSRRGAPGRRPDPLALVVRAVEDIFRQAPKRDINPDEVVAIGAAIQGGILLGSVKDVVLLDVTPLSLGIETHGGIFTKLIERNSTIPTKASQIFTTVVDNQDSVEIHILQGEREIAAENRSLGKIELVGIPPAPRGVPQIEVTFAIDSNSIVTVSARDLATNQSQTIQINPASGLSQEEVGRLVEDADRHATEDQARREVKRLRGRLEGLLYTNERVFEQFVSYLPESDQERIRETFRKALAALISDRREDMEAAMFDLNSVSQDLSDLMLRSTKD